MRTRYLAGWLLLSTIISHPAFSQKTGTAGLIAADSLSSGNYKDIFASFFQLALSDLTGPNKALVFNSNPYAIMLRHDSSLAKYPAYRKYTWLRKLNFSLGAGLDTSYRFNGFTLGLKYALINNRDYTIKKQFLADAINDPTLDLVSKLTVQWVLAISTIPLEKRPPLNAQFQKFVRDSTSRLTNFDSTFQRLFHQAAAGVNSPGLSEMLADPDFNLYKRTHEAYDSLKNLYQTRALWTLGVTDTSYSTGSLLKNVQITSEYLNGLKLSPTCNLELDLKASVNFMDDTLMPGKRGQNISRQVFSFEPGVNLTLRGAQTKQSYFEFKLSGAYNNVWKGLYNGEDQVVNTINATVRILVFDKIWIPVQIKYDPKNHNVFGFLNVTANFNGFGNLFGSTSKKQS